MSDKLDKLQQLKVELDLHPRLQNAYTSLFSQPPEDWDEEWVVNHLRMAFGAGIVARRDRALVNAIRALGFRLERA